MGKARSKKYHKRIFRGNQHVNASQKVTNKVEVDRQLRPLSQFQPPIATDIGSKDGFDADEISESQSVLIDASCQNPSLATCTPIPRRKPASFRKIAIAEIKTKMIAEQEGEAGPYWVQNVMFLWMDVGRNMAMFL